MYYLKSLYNVEACKEMGDFFFFLFNNIHQINNTNCFEMNLSSLH